MLGQAPIEDGGEQGAALAEEGDAAGARDGLGESGVEADERIHHAEAIGADETQRTAGEFGGNLSLEGQAFRTALAKAGGDYDGGLDACRNAFADYAGNGGSGSDDDGKVYFLRDFANGGECGLAEQFGAVEIDREDAAAVRSAAEIYQDGTTDAVLTVRGADDGDVVRMKYSVEGRRVGAEQIVRRVVWLAHRLSGRLGGKQVGVVHAITIGSLPPSFK